MPLLGGPQECNRAVVVSVAKYDPGVRLSDRSGAKKDAKMLHKTLSRLGFKVELKDDLSSQEIYKFFSEESRRPVKDCFLAVLSSHGEDGCVFGADGEPVHLSRIFGYCDNKTMEKKAKLFLIQACRGHALDDGVEVDSAEDPSESSFSQYMSLPIDAAVMYATTPGYVAYMKPFVGSFFLQTFCNLLEEKDFRNLELTRLLTRVSHRVAHAFKAKGGDLEGKKQMPCLLSRLTRDVFPFAEQGKGGSVTGISATSLVSGEKTRTRTHSIS